MTLRGSAGKVVIWNEDDEDKNEQVVGCFKKVVGCIRSLRALYRCASSTDNSLGGGIIHRWVRRVARSVETTKSRKSSVS
jgi:hypothetical protein